MFLERPASSATDSWDHLPGTASGNPASWPRCLTAFLVPGQVVPPATKRARTKSRAGGMVGRAWPGRDHELPRAQLTGVRFGNAVGCAGVPRAKEQLCSGGTRCRAQSGRHAGLCGENALAGARLAEAGQRNVSVGGRSVSRSLVCLGANYCSLWLVLRRGFSPKRADVGTAPGSQRKVIFQCNSIPHQCGTRGFQL